MEPRMTLFQHATFVHRSVVRAVGVIVLSAAAVVVASTGIARANPVQAAAAGDIVLLDFSASWCGPCRSMAPSFEQAGRQLAGRALLVKVDSDENPALSARFGIRSIPTLVRLKDGRETTRQSGALGAAALVALAGAPA